MLPAPISRLPATASALCTPPTTRMPLLPSGPAMPTPAGCRRRIDDAAGGETWTPTSRTAMSPLLSDRHDLHHVGAGRQRVGEVREDRVHLRRASPTKVSAGPLVDPTTMPLKLATPSVPPFIDVSVTP